MLKFDKNLIIFINMFEYLDKIRVITSNKYFLKHSVIGLI